MKTLFGLFLCAELVICVFLKVSRAEAAVVIVKMYENFSGETAPVVATPFTDIGSLPAEQQDSIAKLYGLRITIGTSATTYSPDDDLELYQAFLLAGSTLQRLVEG